MSLIRFITFTDDNMTISAEKCTMSAFLNGATTAKAYRPEDSILYKKGSRGGNFWSWKPEIINNYLQGCEDGDFLIYSDAGVEIINNLRFIADRMKAGEDIWLFGNMYQHEHWCKRDIIEAIYPEGKFGKQCQASVIVLRVSDKSKAFVKEWLEWCMKDELIDDRPSKTPNHPEFKENRHDQAILTTLAYRENIPLHWWPAMYNNGAFTYERGSYPDEGYPVLFSHHRKRNSDWR